MKTKRTKIVVCNSKPRHFNIKLLIFLLSSVFSYGGISGFKKWFDGQFPDAVTIVKNGQQEIFDHVCIDMNQILHPALRQSRNQEHAIKRVYAELNRILGICHPRSSVVLAFDGPAPVAKLQTQRTRRKSAARKETAKASLAVRRRTKKTKADDSEEAKKTEESEDSESDKGISTLALTPGTDFMKAMYEAMIFYACQRVTGRDKRYWNVSFYISGAEMPGEGEIKIMDWIARQKMQGHKIEPKNDMVKRKRESVVIVGGDADLVLQGLAVEDMRNLFVLVPEGKGRQSCISLWECVRTLEKLFPGQSAFVRNDLIILLILNGNDYLPKLRGANFRRVFRRYIQTKSNDKFADRFLIDGSKQTFDLEFAREFFAGLASMFKAPSYDLILKPTAVVRLNEAWQQKRFPGNVEYTIEEVQEAEFSAKVEAGGLTFELEELAPNKKVAKQRVARLALEKLAPDLLESVNASENEVNDDETFVENAVENLKDFADSDSDSDDDLDEFQSEILEDPEKTLSGDNKHYSVTAYLQGLLWNLQMYIDGCCPDAYFCYGHRFAPTAKDIVQWIDENHAKEIEIQVPVSERPALSADVSCLALMPLEGEKYLPAHLAVAMESETEIAKIWKNQKSDLNIEAIISAISSLQITEQSADPNAQVASKFWKVITNEENIAKVKKLGRTRNLSKIKNLPKQNGFSPIKAGSCTVVTGTMKATQKSPNYDWSHPMFLRSKHPNVLKLGYAKAFKDKMIQEKQKKQNIKRTRGSMSFCSSPIITNVRATTLPV